MGTLNSWTVIDANNNAAPPNGWPENTMQYSEVNNTGRAVQGTLARYFRDVNGSLQAGGVADAYTVTLNESGYTAYFAGMYFACKIMATNTGASTIDVNGIGAQAITDRVGNPLTAGELQSGGIYEFRYDGAQFQLMDTVAGTINVPSGVLSNSNAPDLVDTDVALNVGATDPDTSQHIEVGPQDIQSKSNATTAADLRLNQLGGITRLYGGATERLSADAFGLAFLRSVGNTDAESRAFLLAHQDGTQRGFIGHNGADPTLTINQNIPGENVALRANDALGTLRTLFEGNPDGAVTLYHNGAVRFDTASEGISVTAPAAPGILLTRTGNNRNANVHYIGNVGSGVYAGMGAQDVFAIGNAANSSVDSALYFRAGNAEVAMFHGAGNEVAHTLAATAGGMEVNNTLTGAGFERVLTTSDLSGRRFTDEAVKTADEDRSNTTIPTDDNHLTVTTDTAGLYKLQLMLRVRDVAVSSNDFRWHLDFSGGLLTGSFNKYEVINSSTTVDIAQTAFDQPNADEIITNLATGSGTTIVLITYYMRISGSNRDITLQWAQGTSGAGVIRLEADSYMILEQLSTLT